MIKPAYYFVSSEASNKRCFYLLFWGKRKFTSENVLLFTYLNLHIAALFLLDDKRTAFIESSTKFKE